MNGKQGGDPAKLADALVQLAGLDEVPVRFAAGADARSLRPLTRPMTSASVATARACAPRRVRSLAAPSLRAKGLVDSRALMASAML